jgi:ketosteroid isomerase-like protein
MPELEIEQFVQAFAAAWARSDGDGFLDLWHPDGLLHSPFMSRVVKGDEFGMLTNIYKKAAPNLTWTLVGWTSRGNVVVIEWESSNRYDEQVVRWRGVDRITLEDGKIREEVVYADTAPLQARRRGTSFEALIQLPG